MISSSDSRVWFVVAFGGAAAATGIWRSALGRHGVGLLLEPPPGSSSDVGHRGRALDREDGRDPDLVEHRQHEIACDGTESGTGRRLRPGRRGATAGRGRRDAPLGPGRQQGRRGRCRHGGPVGRDGGRAGAEQDRGHGEGGRRGACPDHRREPACVTTAGSRGAGSSASRARGIRTRDGVARACRLRSSRTAPSAATTASTTEVHASRADTGARETTVAGSELLCPTTQRTVLWTSSTPRRCTTTSMSTGPLDGRTSAADHRDAVTAVAATAVATGRRRRAAAARRDATDRQGHARDGTGGRTPRVEDVDERHARPRPVRPQGEGLLQVGDRAVVDDARCLLGDEARRHGGLPGGQESGQGDDDEQADGLHPHERPAGRPAPAPAECAGAGSSPGR